VRIIAYNKRILQMSLHIGGAAFLEGEAGASGFSSYPAAFPACWIR
jgi:hypothetical protein